MLIFLLYSRYFQSSVCTQIRTNIYAQLISKHISYDVSTCALDFVRWDKWIVHRAEQHKIRRVYKGMNRATRAQRKCANEKKLEGGKRREK